MPSSPPNVSPIWHPFTQHATAGPAIEIRQGEGVWLIASDGRRIIDGISSWWVTTHGHAHPRIAAAIAEQASQLEQVIFAGFTHPPAEKLARKLLDLVPPPLEFAFFSDSGSTAVEVGIKLAVGYWHNLGHPRSRIVAIDGGYHGDTFGAMSVGDRGVFTSAYRPMLFDVEYLPFPSRGEEANTIETFQRLLRSDNGSIAALIVEPLVLGAGGMLMYPAWVLNELHCLCRKHDIFFIADEVMTGFGRTGTMFACEQTNFTPDVMCLSKGITGGFLPMGVTLATRTLYDGFWSTDRGRMFFHSSSYTGNPIACAAALANLEIWETEPVLDRINCISKHHVERLDPYRNNTADISHVRQCGTISAFTVKQKKNGYLSDLSPRLYEFFLSRGILLRPLGNVVYILPPYCISPQELDEIYNVIDESLAAIRDRTL